MADRTGNIPEWLFMVYMVANDSNELDSIAVQDLREMERAVAVNPYVEIWAQVHRRWPAQPQRYHIRQQDAEKHRSEKEPLLRKPRAVATTLVTQLTRPDMEATLEEPLK